MAGYRPEFAPHLAEFVRHLPSEAKRGLRAVIRHLSRNPNAGEPLQRELEGLWKYRVKRLRIVYAIDKARRTIQIRGIGHRRSIYEEIAEALRRRR